METFPIPFDALRLDRAQLYRTLGYGDGRPADVRVAEALERVIDEVSAVCRPQAGYALLRAEGIADGAITVSGTVFRVGGRIASCLEEAEYFAFFVATAGREFADWTKREALSGDVFRDFLIDAAGSEIAEAAVRFLSDRLARSVAREGLRIGNSYSPGYCGWNVGEQRGLFALLPSEPCGIRLSGTCLMEPIKSVSGVIPVGRRVVKMAYGCAICTNANCYKMRKTCK